MTHGTFHTPIPKNEPVRDYAPGSDEKRRLKAELKRLASETIEVPLILGGQEVRTGDTAPMVVPHDHGHELGVFHKAGAKEVAAAIDAATEAKAEWAAMPWQERAAVFLRVGDMLATSHRDVVNASTMLNQSKTVHQAEIDSACEAIDFMRFNAHYAERLYGEQPESAAAVWNRLEHRPLDGFVFAVSPFNFTSIAANLPTSPALMGNTVVWKPASTSVYSNYFLMKLFQAAGLPDGVINFVPGSGGAVGDPVLADARLGGVHFTGSTEVFRAMWATIGRNLDRYGQYPRIVGETGGKNFVMVHPSADVEEVAANLVRGAYEYQGQKCSAASRAYVPKSLWGDLRDRLAGMLSEVRMGDTSDFRNFVGAVIDQKSFDGKMEAVEAARRSSDAEVVIGGECDDSAGWFVQPTVLEAKDPHYDTMTRELFGPVLTVFVYEDSAWEDTLRLCDTTSEYGLTGAVFAHDRAALRQATDVLRFAAGNFYLNDKPTGAIVGQQPFGGSRASGTNDKAGSILNLMRWVSPRSIKESFLPARDWRYPFLGEE